MTWPKKRRTLSAGLRRRLRTWALVVFLVPTFVTFASAQDAPVAVPELIQAVQNKKLGELKLPAFWDVTETDDGLRAVEGNAARPASLEIGTIEVPETLPALSIADALLSEMNGAGQGTDVKVKEQVDASGGVEQYYVEVDTTETTGTPIRYGILIVSGNRRAIIAVLGSPTDRFASFAPRGLLEAILGSVRAP